jgi:hypothetical protein
MSTWENLPCCYNEMEEKSFRERRKNLTGLDNEFERLGEEKWTNEYKEREIRLLILSYRKSNQSEWTFIYYVGEREEGVQATSSSNASERQGGWGGGWLNPESNAQNSFAFPVGKMSPHGTVRSASATLPLLFDTNTAATPATTPVTLLPLSPLSPCHHTHHCLHNDCHHCHRHHGHHCHCHYYHRPLSANFLGFDQFLLQTRTCWFFVNYHCKHEFIHVLPKFHCKL